MNIFNLDPTSMPKDAEYYFNILVINIAVRESLQDDKEEFYTDIWYIEHITDPRPYIVHVYAEEDDFFDEDENYMIELYANMAVEISPSLGISFYDMFDGDDEDGDIQLDDLWRLE
ncbi:MAG: hypothetical protein NC218_07365 [Acetobacter sp.]|nr:hypothetical protein [Acetobacter sp.]